MLEETYSLGVFYAQDIIRRRIRRIEEAIEKANTLHKQMANTGSLTLEKSNKIVSLVIELDKKKETLHTLDKRIDDELNYSK